MIKIIMSIVSKLILFPIAIIQFLLAYCIFILNPDLHKFSFKAVQ